MALEVATHVPGLISSNPPGTDVLSQADDHIRLIKTCLLASFPVDLRNCTSAKTGQAARFNGTALGTPNPGGYFTNLTIAQTTVTGTETQINISAATKNELGMYSSGNFITVPSGAIQLGCFICFFGAWVTPSSVTDRALRLRVLNLTNSARSPLGAVFGHTLFGGRGAGNNLTSNVALMLCYGWAGDTVARPLAGDLLAVTGRNIGGSNYDIGGGTVQFFPVE